MRAKADKKSENINLKFCLSGKTTLKYNLMLDLGQGVIAGLHNAADKYMYM